MPRDTRKKPAEARTRQAIIDILKREGPQDAAALAGRLGLSAMAVRQHLYGLRDERLVTFEAQPRPLGRPAKLWRLTAAADKFFPDGHADLTIDLIQAMKQAFGDAGLDKLLAVRTRAQIEAYGRRVKPGDSLPKRLAALAEQRSEEGYMAEARKADDGGYLLVENHCPVCSAAKACTGLCAAELQVFRTVLGSDVKVERSDHILAGARRCAYRVTRAAKAKC
jgi:predicted ArsR family transcriptional regulator